ncbi:MAG TPA: hypothetical protein VF297_22460 [Pyrinomonadaceae bacterium]
MADSLGEVLEAGRWEKALFTTYSLSLTFFESVILRALRKAECREVWVLADVDGYRSSLMERGSGGVGSEYRLIPIGLPKGVFHAKCCYLAGSETDVLAVGSGNLTFGGYGRNLEVLEVLTSQTQPQCFRAFADFLTALKKREDIVCPDVSWAEMFADRAYEVSADGNDEEAYPKLLTSAGQSIKDQLAGLAAASGPVETLTVLSPFFDADARAVSELAAATGTRQVRVALPPGDAPSSFPFPKTGTWTTPVSAVALQREQESRPLHAKWIELKTKEGVFALTGSVNGTRQALCGTNNIEAGVLRFDPSARGWVKWKKAPTPSSYKTHTFRRSGMGATHLVFAELTESGELRGRIIALASTEGTWSGKVQKPDGDSVGVEVVARSDGRFSHALPAGDEFIFASGLQIVLERGGIVARGWVTNATLLSLPKTQRIPLSSILRLINREETEDDDVALLEYLVVHATDHLRVFQGRVAAARDNPETPDGEQDVFYIDLEHLQPHSQETYQQESFAHDPVASAAFALERVFAQLRRRFVGHLPGGHRPAARAVSDEEQPDGEEAHTRARLEERFESAFECFMDGMYRLAVGPAASEEQRRALLVLWLEVALHMLVRRKGDRAEGVAFMRRWLSLSTSLASAEDVTDGLEQHVVTCAAILFACGSAPDDVGGQLHESLEHYWRGEVDREQALGALLPHSRINIAGLFLEATGASLRDNLEKILDTPTLRGELETLLKSAEAGEPLPENLRLLRSDAGRELLAELKKHGVSKRIEFLKNNDFNCPRNFIRLSEACKGELLKNRVARCSYCGLLIVRRAT